MGSIGVYSLLMNILRKTERKVVSTLWRSGWIIPLMF